MKDLTSGNVTKALLIVAIPTMISSLLQFSYNIIDMYFLGQFDKDGSIIASVGTASLFINFAMGIAFLSVLGSGIKCSQSLGAKNYNDFKEYIASGLFITFFTSILTFLFLMIFAPSLISLIGITDETIFSNSVIYLRLYSVAIFFNFFNTFFTRIMSSQGTSDKALKINSVGILVNIILDPILIFGLNLGIIGAGIATIISNCTVTLIFLVAYKDIFIFNPKNLDTKKSVEIMKLGYPYVIQRIIFSTVGIIMGKIMVYAGSSYAIAGQRLGLQIESLTLMVIGGLLTATSSFTGQNFGAGKYERIKEGFNKALQIGIIYALFTGVIFLGFGENLIGLFTTDEKTIYYGSMYLKIISFGQIFAVLEVIGNGLYNGIGKPKIPTIISITITPLRIIFALLLLPSLGAIGVFVAIVITTIMKGIVSYSYYLIKVKKNLSNNVTI